MTFPRTTSSVALHLAVVLAVAAVAMFAALGLVIIAGLWLVSAALVGWATWALRGTPRALRVVLSMALIPLFVILTWEGGLFFIPSAMALIVAHGWEPAPHQSDVHLDRSTNRADGGFRRMAD